MDFSISSQVPILEIPIHQNILVMIALTNLSPNHTWLLRIAKRVLSKYATTWLYAPYNITRYFCKFGISRIPQVSNARIIDIKSEEDSYLASDGLTLVLVPQSSCYSWSHDTVQFHLVDFDDHMYIHGSEYSSDETLRMLVSLWSLRPSPGRADVLASFQCSKEMHNVAQALTEWDPAVQVLHIAKPPTRSSNQGLSRLSPRPYTTPPPSPPQSSSLRFFTLLPSPISPRKQDYK